MKSAVIWRNSWKLEALQNREVILLKTVLIAMSGGVDSSVAAYLLQQQGFRCVGATMRLGSGLQDAQDARSVAERLGIPFYVLDMQADFDRLVKDDFVRSYEAGFTPNPCIQCNRRLKFGLLLERRRSLAATIWLPGTMPVSPGMRKLGGISSGRRWTVQRIRAIFSTALPRSSWPVPCFPWAH